MNALAATKKKIIEEGLDKDKQYFEYYCSESIKPRYAQKRLFRRFIITFNQLRSNRYNCTASFTNQHYKIHHVNTIIF